MLFACSISDRILLKIITMFVDLKFSTYNSGRFLHFTVQACIIKCIQVHDYFFFLEDYFFYDHMAIFIPINVFLFEILFFLILSIFLQHLCICYYCIPYLFNLFIFKLAVWFCLRHEACKWNIYICLKKFFFLYGFGS